MRRLSFALAVMLLAAACQAADNQTGEKHTVRFSKRMLFAAPYENCAVADLNRDGKLDIVYEDYWLEGPNFVPHAFRPNHTSSDFIRTNSVFVYDLDGDGWPDIITGGWNEDGIYWYKNPGNSAKEKGAPGTCTRRGKPICWPKPAAGWKCLPCTISTAMACPSCIRPAT